MKKVLLSAATLALFAAAANADVYNGNGGTGFGGAIGNSTITVTDAGLNVNFSITSPVSTTFDGNNLVLYIDSVAGGVNDNSTFTDTGTPAGTDPGRRAISGLSDSGRSLVTLPVGFGADFAVSAEIGSFAGAFNLSTPSNFGFVSSGGIAGSGAGPITFSFAKTDLGLPASGAYSFNFVGTLISGTAYRSNETYGTSVTAPAATSLGDAPNAGFLGTQTFSVANTFAVPEPTSIALAGVGAAALLRRRRA